MHRETLPTPLAPASAFAGRALGDKGRSDALPPTLQGAFLRNGPNPFFADMPGGYHWFDGDGLVHCVRLRGDAHPPTYSSHYVRTRRLAAERAAGGPVHPKLGEFVGAPGLGVLLLDKLYLALGLDGGERRAHGSGTGNTALAHHASRILALNEGDLPYALRIACGGLVETVGRVTFGGAFGVDGRLTTTEDGGGGKPSGVAAVASSGRAASPSASSDAPASAASVVAAVTSFTAHPKLDPRANLLHAFRYTFDAAPYAYYLCIGADGAPKAAPHALTSLPRATMMHDFAVTARHAVFFDLPLVFDGSRMIREKQLPFKFAPEHGARVGLLPFSRALGSAKAAAAAAGADGADGVVWYQADEPFMMFHTAACWEEEAGEGAAGEGQARKDGGGGDGEEAPPGVVRVVVAHHETISLDLDRRCDDGKKKNKSAAAAGAGGPPPSIPDGERPRMALLTLDPATRRCSTRRLTGVSGDFPVINPRLVGKKARFVFFATLSDAPGRTVKFDGIAKLDLQAAEDDPSRAECVVGRVRLPEGYYCGEAVFAPRYEDPELCSGEDDGWLLAFAHDESPSSSSTEEGGGGGGKSWFLVFDAATMDSTPVAAFELPARVPYGFHGLFAPESAVQAARLAEPADVL